MTNAAHVERESGLFVPAHLAREAEIREPHAPPDRPEGGVDPDGRTRIVMPADARKALRALGAWTSSRHLGVFFTCQASRQVVKPVTLESGAVSLVTVREEIPGKCGEIFLREGQDTGDPGFGCKCTRIHFVRGV